MTRKLTHAVNHIYSLKMRIPIDGKWAPLHRKISPPQPNEAVMLLYIVSASVIFHMFVVILCVFWLYMSLCGVGTIYFWWLVNLLSLWVNVVSIGVCLSWW